VDGQFEYNALRSNARFFLDQEGLIDRTFVYHDGESYFYHFDRDWEAGEHRLRFELRPLPALEGSPPSRDSAYIRWKIVQVSVTGPTEEARWVKPANYDRIFPRDLPPTSDPERGRQYNRAKPSQNRGQRVREAG
jgi:hypothetical protein